MFILKYNCVYSKMSGDDRLNFAKVYRKNAISYHPGSLHSEVLLYIYLFSIHDINTSCRCANPLSVEVVYHVVGRFF